MITPVLDVYGTPISDGDHVKLLSEARGGSHLVDGAGIVLGPVEAGDGWVYWRGADGCVHGSRPSALRVTPARIVRARAWLEQLSSAIAAGAREHHAVVVAAELAERFALGEQEAARLLNAWGRR